MIDAMRAALEALEYHQEQTRPIHKTQETIAALRQAIREAALDGLAETSQEIEPWDTSDMAHRAGGLSIEQTPDDLLRQSEREGWRYAKECEAEVKRLTDLNHQLVTAAKELGAADDVAEWDDAWAKMAKLMRQGEINATSSQDGR
jgi:hypothetical protein